MTCVSDMRLLAQIQALRAFSDSPRGVAAQKEQNAAERRLRASDGKAALRREIPGEYWCPPSDVSSRVAPALMPLLRWVTSTGRNALLSGHTGSGKSTVAACALRRHVGSALDAPADDWSAALSIAWVSVRALVDERRENRSELLARAKGARLVVLDEVTRGNYGLVESVLWHRFDRSSLRTICTVDTPVERMGQILDPACVRRLTEDRGQAALVLEAW